MGTTTLSEVMAEEAKSRIFGGEERGTAPASVAGEGGGVSAGRQRARSKGSVR